MAWILVINTYMSRFSVQTVWRLFTWNLILYRNFSLEWNPKFFPVSKAQKFSKNLENHLKIPDLISRICTWNLKLLGATVQNVVATATWRPVFAHPCNFVFTGIRHCPVSWYSWFHNKISHRLRREEKPTRCHCVLYCIYDTLNMFRALLCPSSGALY